MKLGLAHRLIAVVMLPFLGATAAALFFWHHTSVTAPVPTQINLAGRQRMLVVQLGDWAQMVALGHERDRPGLLAATAEYEAILAALAHGAPPGERPVAPVAGEARDDLERLRIGWGELRGRLEAVAAGGASAEARRELAASVERQRLAADALALELERAFAEGEGRVMGLLLSCLALNVALLLLAATYFRRRIVRPLDEMGARLENLESVEVRLRAEARASEDTFQALVDNAPDILAIHRGGVFVRVNGALLQALGHERADELLGRSVLEIVHPEDREQVVRRMHQMMTTGAIAPLVEERFVRRDGATVTAEVMAMKIVYEGQPAILVIAQDVSERKALTARRMELDRIVAAGHLAAGVGHEINNPLAYVVSNLELLAEEVPPEMLDLVQETQDGVNRIRVIVEDLKLLSRGDTDRRGPVDLRRIMDSSLSIVRNEIRHRARLTTDYAAIPMVSANETRLGRVFVNLLLNAAQALPEGHAEDNAVRVRIHAEEGQVVVEVEDTGCGIPEANLARLFEPFFTTRPVGKGTGLGLSICREIVDACGGQIRVQSRVGEGTTVRVTLPALPPVAEAPRSTGAAAPPATRRPRILLIDDEPLVCRAMERTLARDHDVVAHTSARAALEILRGGDHFDRIFCDLMMPDMAGMDFYSALRAIAPDQAERVVFLTGGAFAPRAQAFLETVSNPHLVKPFDREQLAALSRDMME